MVAMILAWSAGLVVVAVIGGSLYVYSPDKPAAALEVPYPRGYPPLRYRARRAAPRRGQFDV